MYGWTDDPNQWDPVLPLMDLPFVQWWFHGYINQPPADGQFMTLPSGGTYNGQVSSIRTYPELIGLARLQQGSHEIRPKPGSTNRRIRL